MSNKVDILNFNKNDEYNDIEVSKILDFFNIDKGELLKKAFKSLNMLISFLNDGNDEYVKRKIKKNINLISYVCNNEILSDKEILSSKDRIKKARESLLAYANKYNDSLLYECSNNLDEIILSKLMNVVDLNKLIKELIDRKEDIDIIKKIVNINKAIITYNEDELFNYTFERAYDSIKNRERSIFYYITLLKLFYHSRIKKDKYINKLIELDDLNNKKAEIFIKEVASLLYGNKRSLSTKDILKKYNLNEELIDNKIVFCPKRVTCNDKIFTMDSDNAVIREDGLSIRKDGNNYIVGIHVSDAGLLVHNNNFIDHQAKSNFKCVYLANGYRIIPLLPESYERNLSLEENDKKNAISLYVVLNDSGDLLDYYVKENVLFITKNYSISYSNDIIDNYSRNNLEKGIKDLYELSCALHMKNKIKNDYWKKKNSSKQNSEVKRTSKSDQINSEFIILYNSLLGKIAKDNNFPYIFRYQDKEYISKLIDELNIELDDETSKLINNIYLYSKYSSEPKFHSGLGIDYYTQSSDPIRKYPDLYNQYLLHMFYFKDINCDFNEDKFKKLIEYFNQRDTEIKLMRSECDREMRLEKKIRNS